MTVTKDNQTAPELRPNPCRAGWSSGDERRDRAGGADPAAAGGHRRGGVRRAERGAGAGGHAVRVLVLDRNNYHGFWPLLYQVATAGLEPESIAYPVRAILRKYRNVRFRMPNVERVDVARRQVIPARGPADPL